MRAVIWLVLLFAVAVVASSTLGTNDGLVSFYVGGWRLDVSLNLFLIALVATCAVLVTVFQGLNALLGLPQRAREWRVARRERNAQAALRDALAQLFGGRYGRAQKSAQRALAIQARSPDLEDGRAFDALAHLLVAASAHRLQNRPLRNEALEQALLLSRRNPSARVTEEGARLLAAEWALDDRDAPRALQLLAELPVGVARRTHALRLKLRAHRLGQQPMEALRTARLLAKHQALSPDAAQGLLRTLAFEALASARDADQLRRAWVQFEPADRHDPFVVARAAARASALQAPEDARGWLRPFWDRLGELAPEERSAVAEALVAAAPGIGAEWLPRLEAAALTFPREPAIALAVGVALAERQLWGMARRLLEQAGADPTLGAQWRRTAWLALAKLALRDDDEARAAACYEAAARSD